MGNYKHTLFYAKDKENNIHKSIGFTTTNEIILAPKYIPDIAGDRTSRNKKYTALNFPFQSFQLIYSDEKKLKLSEIYGQFLPIFNRDEINIFEPQARLQERISENNNHMSKVKKLLEIFNNIANLEIPNFGLDASLLCGLEKDSSDIDLLIFGVKNTLECFSATQKMKRLKYIKSSIDERELYLYRRQPYSLMMTDEEILYWESRKISFLFKNTKVSILPIDNSISSIDYKFISTGQFVAVIGYITQDQIVFEPGDIKISNSKVIYGPQVNINQIHTIIPVRTGVFLKKGDKIFATGIIYRKISKNKNEFVLAQCPWDYYKFYKKTGVAFIIKIDLSQLSENLYTNILKAITTAS